MKKMSVTTTLVLLALMLGSTVAYASFNWCQDDPVLSIDGTEVNVIIEIGLEEGQAPEGLVNGPVHVKVSVPSNDETYVIETGDGFNGKGERVTIIPDGEPVEPGDAIKVRVKARVQTDDPEGFPVRVTILSESNEGWSNTWVECAVEL